ncbi:hypothetical protein CHS0354_023162 [Potamilus streckersoni]|uniref:Alcohol dehydrogenase iron-type/glycerol dehydrogenase GldA domain-containing protein n=1 Tax=Potamilus streckersoni TaxID=2493646 RepID=A0AAE0VFV6_9BIVA|nr:hypothetical protein CHS0354_023162 [Potamilus streckersoni]
MAASLLYKIMPSVLWKHQYGYCLQMLNMGEELHEKLVSFKEAIDFAKEEGFDCFVAVGGGSVIDTCKAANLYSSNPDANLLDYVNVPIGKGMPVTHAQRPLIAVTTTPGTGSETTGTAVFDYLPMKAKTGTHAIESYTAIPFKKRGPRPEDPILRPTYQGSNPISDIWSLYALRITSKYLKSRTDK